MSRLLSSAKASFAQASYTPLRDSRQSSESIAEEDDLDPNSISSPQRPNRHTSQRTQHSNQSAARGSSQNTQQSQHVLTSDSEEDDEGGKETDGIYKDRAAHGSSGISQRDASGDSSDTVVSIEHSSGSPSPKCSRESFEFSEPNYDRGPGRDLDVEEAGGEATGDEGTSEQGLWQQAFTTLVIAVSGLICAGWLLDAVQHWEVFIEISELIILIPILLNLKGNLEMNLASRLSTASNMGLLDKPETRNAFIKGNLALLQLQSLTVASVAGSFSFVLGMIVHPTTNNLEEIALMISSSMLCASISSFVLGSFMCCLVLLCRHFKVNPDNIACPLASSFGDLITLVILSGCAVFLVKYIQTPLCLVLLLILLALIPMWLYYVRQNEFVSEVVKEGWGPVFAAMLISSTAGLTLERYINQFPGMGMIAPVLNGLTGNIGSIYVSRISTSLHANVKENYRSTEKTLFLVHIPIQVLFLTVISVLGLGDIRWSTSVVFGYAVVALTMVTVALILAKWITTLFWRWGYNPDNTALPFLTSLMDVLGTTLLVACFWVLGYGKNAT